MATAALKDYALGQRIKALDGMHGLATPDYVANILRRAQLTLHRWAEEMCNGTIQRNDPDDKIAPNEPRRYWDRYNGTSRGSMPIPDREAGALRRVAEVCKSVGLHFYHQTDPRGCALYVAAEPLTHDNYSSKGIPCL